MRSHLRKLYEFAGDRVRFSDKFAERYPVALLEVSLSIGSTDSMDFEYLRKFKVLADEIQPKWRSDHL